MIRKYIQCNNADCVFSQRPAITNYEAVISSSYLVLLAIHLHNNRMLNNEYVSTNANLRNVLNSNAADRPNEEITISSKHALIKRMAWAMLRLLQERAGHQGMQYKFLRTEGPTNDASTIDR